MKSVRAFVTLALLTTVAFACPAIAEKFPDKPVKIVLPYPPGTGPDTVMRQVADKLNRSWGQPVIIENKPGGNGWIAVETAKKAAPEGYTLLQVDTAIFGLQPNLFRKLPFDPVKDFEPVSGMYWTHYFIVVNASSPWNSVTDLITAAKAKPLNYGSSGVGSQAHLGGAALEGVAGVKMTHVPYKDSMQMFGSVATGDIDWFLSTAASSGSFVKANKVKFLAIAAPQRHPLFPTVPTVAESGGPSDYEMKVWVALFAPRGTPKPIVDQINADVAKAMNDPDVRERLTQLGVTSWPAAPAELAQQVKADIQQYGDINKRLKISLD